MEKQKKCKKQKILLSLTIVLLGLMVWTLWANSALKLHKVSITNNQIPAAFSGYKIAQVSDLHNAEFGEQNKKLLAMIMKEEPDMIAITGDIIDSNHTDCKVAVEFAREAVKIAPCYYVTGNHEAWTKEYGELEQGLKSCGVTVLHDEAVTLKQSEETIRLIGLDDPDFKNSEMISERIRRLKQENEEYTILLSHRPELFEEYCASDINLALSGHAHGGQFRLPFLGGLVAPNQGFLPKYDAGVYEEKETSMVVSRGLGNSIIPLRVNNRPEIVMVELVRGE